MPFCNTTAFLLFCFLFLKKKKLQCVSFCVRGALSYFSERRERKQRKKKKKTIKNTPTHTIPPPLFHPFTTHSGRNRTHFRLMPAAWHASTTADTSL